MAPYPIIAAKEGNYMEISTQIKQRRTAAGLSQEELAEQLFVTRQTLSNWETGKTYPDINSLLRLSAVFPVSLDELVKGDIKTMEEEIKKMDIEELRRETSMLYTMMVVVVLSDVLAAVIGGILGPVLFLASLAVLLVYFLRVDKLMKKHNLSTYREIKAFLDGKRLDELETAVEKGKQPYQMAVLILAIAFAGAVSAIVMPIVLGLLGFF